MLFIATVDQEQTFQHCLYSVKTRRLFFARRFVVRAINFIEIIVNGLQDFGKRNIPLRYEI